MDERLEWVGSPIGIQITVDVPIREVDEAGGYDRDEWDAARDRIRQAAVQGLRDIGLNPDEWEDTDYEWADGWGADGEIYGYEVIFVKKR